MIRCGSCGVRLPGADPCCPQHGHVPVGTACLPCSHELPVVPGYEIGRCLGVGGFGAVYLGTALDGSERTVAIKVARADVPEAARRLALEAAYLRRVGAPVVPEVIAAGESPRGNAWIALEYVPWPTLADRLAAARGPLPRAQAQAVTQSLLTTLARFHDAGLVHRDLKPDNVFVGDDGSIRLFDLGLTVEAGKDIDPRHDAAAFAGTAEYMAPEQCDGSSRLDSRADLYAVAIMIYELANGAPPFWGCDADVREAHRSRRPPPTPALPSAVAAVLAEALAKDPNRRPASAGQLLEALRRTWLEPDVAGPAPLPGPRRDAGVAPKPPRERITVGLLWMRTSASVGDVLAVIRSVGGHLAHTDGQRHVLAFGHDLGDNPVRSALRAARAVLARALAASVIIDVGSLVVRRRQDGTPSLMHAGFSQAENYPVDDDPSGVLLTTAATDLMSDLSVTPAGRRGLFRPVEAEATTQFTRVFARTEQFVGHDALVQRLQTLASRTVRDGPTAVSVVAESGFGKSELAAVLTAKLLVQSGRFAVHSIRLLEPVGDEGQDSAADLIRRVCGLGREAPADGGRALLAEKGATDHELWLGAALGLGWISCDDPAAAPLRVAPGALRASMSRGLGRLLVAAAGQRPLAILLDDAHFADDLLLDVLEIATSADSGARAPVWACLIGRPRLLLARPTFGNRAAVALHLELPALDVASASVLARRLLAPAANISDRAIEILLERTRCVPMMLVELIRALRRDGILRPGARGDGWFLATDELESLPALAPVEWLAQREIDALPASLIAHGGLASLLGTSFANSHLEGVVRELEREGALVSTDLDATVGLDRLRRAGILMRDGAGRLRFRHPTLQQLFYDRVPEPARRNAHAIARRWYSECTDLSERERLAYVSFHAAKSGERDTAANGYLELARAANDRHAYLEAEQSFRSALGQLDDTDLRMTSALWGRGLARFRLGRHEDALLDLDKICERWHRAGDVAMEIDALLDVATVLDWMDDYARSSALVEQACALAQGRASALQWARLTMSQGRSQFRFSKIEEGSSRLLEAAEQSARLGDAGYETRMISLLLAGAGVGMMGDVARSRLIYDECIALAKAHHDAMHLAAAYQNRAFVWMSQGAVDELFADLNRMIAIARETGFPILEGRALYNLGEVAVTVGDYSAAIETAERSVVLHRQLTGPGGRTITSLLLLARAQVAACDRTGARVTLERLCESQHAARERGRADAELVPSDAILFDAVLLATGTATEEEWDDVLRRAAADSVQQERIEVLDLCSLAAAWAGDGQRAESLRREACQVAAEIPNLMGPRLAARASADRLAG